VAIPCALTWAANSTKLASVAGINTDGAMIPETDGKVERGNADLVAVARSRTTFSSMGKRVSVLISSRTGNWVPLFSALLALQSDRVQYRQSYEAQNVLLARANIENCHLFI
jgi:hypothetical protein